MSAKCLIAVICLIGGCGGQADSAIKTARVTGASMSPTIWGDHALMVCQACRIQWKASWQPEMRPRGEIHCWNCGQRGSVQEANLRSGDIVHIDTAAYRSAGPNIDDIVAVRDSAGMRIKRVVGTEGQTISSRSEILWRDDQPMTSAAPWLVVHHDGYRDSGNSWWQVAASASAQQTPTGFKITVDRASDSPVKLIYSHRSPYNQLRADRVRDDYSGNLTEIRRLHEVTVLGIQAEIDAPGGALLRCWKWSEGGGVSEIEHLSPGRHRLDVRWSEPDTDIQRMPAELDAEHPICLCIEDGTVAISNLVVLRPILYWIDARQPSAVALPLVIPPGHYFLIGDNVPLSVDSRQQGLVAGSQIVGKVLDR